MTDYRITVKVQNNNIIKRILEAGYKSVNDFCNRNPTLKVYKTALGSIINMKTSPLNTKGDYCRCIKEAALVLNCLPDDFFTEQQLNTSLADNKRVIQVKEAELRYVLENYQDVKSLEQIVYEGERAKSINHLLETLPQRQRQVIEMRMGLGVYRESHTCDEIGEILHVSRARVSQIELKALHKLQIYAKSLSISEFCND